MNTCPKCGAKERSVVSGFYPGDLGDWEIISWCCGTTLDKGLGGDQLRQTTPCRVAELEAEIARLRATLANPAWLAAALASYEADEPHTGRDSTCYPPIRPDVLAAYLERPHCGDCTHEPAPCVRCMAEEAMHKARWLIEKAKEKP